MKNLLVFLMVFAVVGTASASSVGGFFVENGEFTGDANSWSATGGEGTFFAEHNSVDGNDGGYVTLRAGGWAIWYPVPYTFYLRDAGIPAGTEIDVEVDMKIVGTPSILRPAVLIESWDSVVADGNIYPMGLLDNSTNIAFLGVTAGWTTFDFASEYPGNYTIFDGTFVLTADAIKIVLIAAENEPTVTSGYDNVKFYVMDGVTDVTPGGELDEPVLDVIGKVVLARDDLAGPNQLLCNSLIQHSFAGN